MEHYVYLYSDPSRNNEPIYVGLGKGERVNFHLRRKDKHPLTHRLNKMKSLGIAPTISFIAKNLDRELAGLVEIEAINKFGRKDLNKGPLLNLTDGDDGVSGRVVSDEERAKQKIVQSSPKVNAQRMQARADNGLWSPPPSWKALGRQNPFAGKTHTQEAKDKARATRKANNVKGHWLGKTLAKFECVHCHKMMARHLLNRWHNDNCQEKT